MRTNLKAGKYVVAVSGGVDSVTLLDLLSKKEDLQLIVAHYDHGIRSDSNEDRKFVEKLANVYELPFVYKEGKLGENTSEATAREARYDFLREVRSKKNARAIVTAHHRDDAMETLIINLIRGTGRRGIIKETETLKRPLLNISKSQILKYAEDNKLKWRDDPSNLDTRYLRNYVRQTLLPRLRKLDPQIDKKLLDSNRDLSKINLKIDEGVEILIGENCQVDEKSISIPRNWLIMLPNEVGVEVIYESIRSLDKNSGVDRKNLRNLLVFSKTARNKKKTHISSDIDMRIESSKVVIELV